MENTVIKLTSLKLTNFKGYKNFQADLSNDIVNVIGDNATRKTTLFDAFTWLFFGKDSSGNSDTKFSIKTIDASTGKVIQRVDHIVEAEFLVNGEKTTAKRELKEKWTKKKGALKKVYTGNLTNYYWNDVPLTKREYELKINDIISESVFKLITDPYAFNGLHWEKQREILTKISGEVSDKVVAGSDKDFLELLSKLTNKTLKDYKKQIKGSIKELKKNKDSIPSRIDELLRGKPEQIDFDTVKHEIEKQEKLYSKVDDKISDQNNLVEDAFKQKEVLRNKISKLTLDNNEIKYDVTKKVRNEELNREQPLAELRTKISEKENYLESLNRKLGKVKASLQTDQQELEEVKTKRNQKSQEWDKMNSSALDFDENQFKCPSCKRPLDEDDIEQTKSDLQKNFNKDKSDKLKAINIQGMALKDQQSVLEEYISGYEKDIKDVEGAITERNKSLKSLNSELSKLQESLQGPTESESDKIESLLSKNDEYQENIQEIESLNESLDKIDTTVDVSDLKEQRSVIQSKIDELKSKLSKQSEIKRVDDRVAELEKEEQNNSQLLADAEKELFVVEEFEKAKSKIVENSVNKMFKHVTFRMFDTLVDGTQTPACVCLFKNVPFPDVNTAGKIQAGLDIINTLCKYYEKQAVIFIDGAESITEIPDTESQQVRLIVKKGVKPLVIE